MKTTLMRTISIALFISRDALSGGGTHTAQCAHVALHSLRRPGRPADTLHTNTYNCIFELFDVTFNAQLKPNGFHLTKRNHEATHLVCPPVRIPPEKPPKKKNRNPQMERERPVRSRRCTFYSVSSSINGKLQRTSAISSSTMNPPASIYSLTDAPF